MRCDINMGADNMEMKHVTPRISGFGKYLGSGGFGFVFEEGVGSVTLTALKITVSDNSNQPKMPRRRNALREYQTIVGKRHKNIVKLISVSEPTYNKGEVQELLKGVGGEDRAGMFIWKGDKSDPIATVVLRMELCGPTLRQWLNYNADREVDDKLSHFQVEIVIGLVEGLKFLHSCQIMHRDLKPENIMFTYSPNEGVNVAEFKLPVKIGDFGLCRQMHGAESAGFSSLTNNVGTELYKAPETFSTNYSLKADLYSLGLVLWEVLQLIPKNMRARLFDKLVNEDETDLVAEHPKFLNSKEVIICLTRKGVEGRSQHIDKVVFVLKSDTKISLSTADNLKTLEDGGKPWGLSKLATPLLILLVSLVFAATILIISVAEIYPNFPEQISVFSSKGLQSALSNKAIRVIELVGSDFETTFPIVLASNVTLKGMGSQKTRIQTKIDCNYYECNKTIGFNVIKVNDNCEISGLEISASDDRPHIVEFGGNRSKLRDVSLDRVHLWIRRNENSVSNLTVKNIASGLGISLRGNRNKLEYIEMENITDNATGYRVFGDENEVSNVVCEKVVIPFSVAGGTKNRLTNILFKSGYSRQRFDRFEQIRVEGGSGHVISNLTCESKFGAGQCGLSLTLRNVTENVSVGSSTFESVIVDGTRHHLSNIRATKLLGIKGSYHEIIKCFANEWINQGSNYTIIGGDYPGKGE